MYGYVMTICAPGICSVSDGDVRVVVVVDGIMLTSFVKSSICHVNAVGVTGVNVWSTNSRSKNASLPE
jgi:hypothetical protein